MPIASPQHADHPDLIALGAAIRQARLEKKISQEELAHQSEIDRSYMSSIERGQQNPGIASVLRIARALEITGAELLARAQL
ncbi:helix-turn-helix domain-containing protein [Ottowia thiooxydans]|uniref:Transcriptional regulator with XRE-family HTH domain n=1 Tax=Ottowia thiooxydans TaxID=219182 RepID=A0ABV2Q7V1_9BURK